MNPLVQPLITYNMPETVIRPINEPTEETTPEPIIPIVYPFVRPVICPALIRTVGGNTVSHIKCNQMRQAYAVAYLQ